MDKNIGRIIKKKREELGYSIRELAKKIDMSPVYLCNIENGKRNLPSDYKLLLIANVLFLSQEEKITFFDKISESQKRIPIDVNKYLFDNKEAIVFIRSAEKHNYKNSDWEKLLNLNILKNKK